MFCFFLFALRVDQNYESLKHFSFTLDDIGLSMIKLTLYGIDKSSVGVTSIATIESKPFYAQAVSLPEKFEFNNADVTLTTINSSAFNQTLIYYINLPSTITKIAGWYGGNSQIRSANFSHLKIEILPRAVFGDCTKLETVNLPPTLKYIPPFAFFKCRSIRNIEFPNNTDISDAVQAFAYCSLLNSLNMINVNATKIPEKMFYYCSSLSEISVINENIKEIGPYAFFKTALAKINVSKNTVLYDSCFRGLISYNPTIEVSCSYIPSSCFADCNRLYSIKLNEGVLTIGHGCFHRTPIESITIPSTLTEIHENAFLTNTKLRVFNASHARVKYIGTKAFYGTYIKTACFSDSLQTIYNFAFADSQISEFYFGKNITYLGEGVFSSCRNLVNVNLSQIQAPYLNGKLFYRCTNLESVIAPIRDKIDIGSSCFEDCISLKNISISNNVSISSAAFKNCKSLVVFEFDFCFQLANDAFFAANKLEHFGRHIPDGQQIPHEIDLTNVLCYDIGNNLFTYITNPVNLTFGSEIGSIGTNAFAGCTSIECIDFKSSKISSIPEKTFVNCISIRRIYLGPKLSSIRARAFSGSKEIHIFSCYQQSVTVEPTSFDPDVYIIYYSYYERAYFNITKADRILKCFKPNQGIPTPLPTAEPIPADYGRLKFSQFVRRTNEPVLPAPTFYHNIKIENYWTDGKYEIGKVRYFSILSIAFIVTFATLIFGLFGFFIYKVIKDNDVYTHKDNIGEENYRAFL